jgi:hypothetical protein
VWKDVTILDVKDEKEKCACNHYGKIMVCSSNHGTSHIDRHLEKTCPYYSKQRRSKGVLSFVNFVDSNTSTLTN